MTIWTHGVWSVKPGRADDFVAAWQAMARDAVAEFRPIGSPHLLRDRERPNVFRSFGPWSDPESVQRFRASIAPRLIEMQELTESIEFSVLDEVPFDG
jgi:heme-degrading monooxygenase HmoA